MEIVGQYHGEQSADLDGNNIDEYYHKQTFYLQTWIEKCTKYIIRLRDWSFKLYLNIATYEPLNHLECEVENNNVFKHPKQLTMTEKNTKDFDNATQCWIYEQEIKRNKNNPKVRDHCHFTGEYRAHKKCSKAKQNINPCCLSQSQRLW